MPADRESTVPKPEFVNVFDMRKVTDVLKAAEEDALKLERIFDQAKTLSFEKFDCPMCKSLFMSRLECVHHISLEHPLALHERPLFCDICLKSFADRKSMEQHESYHKRVLLLMENRDIEVRDPEILLPENACEVTDAVNFHGEPSR